MKIKTATIRHKTVGEGMPYMVIAEIACAHEGNYGNLLKLIDLACETGADAVKFQVFNMGSHMTPHHRIFELAKKLEFTAAQWKEAVAYARSKTDAIICADVYDMGSVQTVAALNVDMVKIHSADLNNFPLIKEVARFKKPTMLGTGASTFVEIAAGLEAFRAENADSFVGLMHGYQAFPTKLEELNILQIPTIKERFDVPVGFLDHIEGDTDESLYVSLLARAVGAFAVERHIVLDRSLKGVDHESALSLPYFKKFVDWVRKSEAALGNPVPGPLTPEEIKYRELMKKMMVAARDISIGEKLNAEMIAFKRSKQPGLSGQELSSVLGKTTKVKISKDDNILQEGLVNE